MGAEPKPDTLDVLIEDVHAAGYAYAQDQGGNGVRLAGVTTPRSDWPGDVGVVPESLGEDGAAVPVLVLGSYATFPGCRVTAAPIGLLEVSAPSARHVLVVAVPVAEPARAAVTRLEELPPSVRGRLDAMPRGTQHRRWGDAAAAIAYVRAARRAYRVARAEQEHNLIRGPAWEVRDRSVRRAHRSEVELHTEAEYTVYALPYRFQNFARECLLPNERLLLHVLRPPLQYGGLWGVVGRQSVHEALIVLTDQQVLLLVDALSPERTLVDWGYIARAAPLERLLGATVRDEGKLLWLDLRLATAAAPVQCSIEFGAEHREVCHRLADILSSFSPAENTRRLLRRYAVAPSAIAPDIAAFLSQDVVRRLEDALAARLDAGEQVLAQAITPSAVGGGNEPCLLAATSKRVLIVPLPGQKRLERALAGAVWLDELGAVEVRNALLGPCFRLWRGTSPQPEVVEISFPYPLVKPFRALFLTIRQLLASPPGVPIAIAPQEPLLATGVGR